MRGKQKLMRKGASALEVSL